MNPLQLGQISARIRWIGVYNWVGKPNQTSDWNDLFISYWLNKLYPRALKLSRIDYHTHFNYGRFLKVIWGPAIFEKIFDDISFQR